MTQNEMQAAARDFAAQWLGRGDEKQETQRFWIGLLGEVLGIRNPASYIEFEKRVKLSHTSYIDAYIPETKVLIEQKGLKIDLKKAYEQSDGTVLTPYEQAKRYVNDMKASEKPRWIVVCNFAEFDVYDMKTPGSEPEVIFLKDLEKDFYRLEFLADRRNENIRREEEISLAAGKLVGKMYDALVKEYWHPEAADTGETNGKTADENTQNLAPEQARSLNILCVRLVFCFYAEDAGLFATRTAFEDYLRSFNLQNVRLALINLFKALDTKIEERDKYDTSLAPFPYVNGGLFKDEKIEIPNFTQEIVDVLCNDCAAFNWSEISPTIFGAVFESTLNPETRREGGMHYTSIENIHKVIDPLFMDSLNNEFEQITGIRKSQSTETSKTEENCGFDKLNHRADTKNISGTALSKTQKEKLTKFQKKLGSLTFLDPACGSGNFLTETFLSLRRLENKVIAVLNKGERVFGFDEFIHVKISRFFGIEINDFAVTVAKTALWIAESQMINETEKIMGKTINFLPLTTNAFIVEGNALRMDWSTLNPLDGHEPANAPIDGLFAGITTHVDGSARRYDYIMGNPPFVGYAFQSKEQKDDLEDLMKGFGKNIDYVAGWYYKASQLIKGTNTRCALVSTNSITQGEQVAAIWKPLFEQFGIHFDFAYRTFRWDSEASIKAHVHCVIIGFSCDADCHSELVSETQKPKIIYLNDNQKIEAKNINGYLIDSPNVFLENRNKPICNVQEIVKGSSPVDGGNLIIEAEDYDEFIKKEPNAKKFIKPFLGAEEFINNKKRYCLWLVDASPAELRKMPLVMERVENVRKMRLASSKAATRKFADYSTRFMEIRQPKEGSYLLVPRVSSEKRRYIPVGFLDCNTIASDAAQIIPNATIYDFGILTSNVHNAWMRSVCGRLKSDYRYSNKIVYNNFPWPAPSPEQKAKIEQTAQAILDARTKYPESSLADLYDETVMPPDLRRAHNENDRAVMQAYGFPPELTESEIVAELFKLYKDFTQDR